MKDGHEKNPSGVEGKLDYMEPVLVRLDEREKFSLGMCGVGVTGNTICGPGNGNFGICSSGNGAAPP